MSRVSLMKLENKVCERARRARDPQYDGRFFVAVKTTGIFCRPICPAPLAQEKNVVYYPSAAAASEDGFRPCLRCRPEAAPGSSEWDESADVVRRALVLIRDGYLNDNKVSDLSDRLGISERQLRRFFQKYLGSSPVAVANMHRVFFVKKLMTDVSLSITDIAMAAGFGTIRQCNAMFRKIYGCAPGDLRRSRKGNLKKEKGFRGVLKLSYRPPYDWEALLAFLEARLVEGIEMVENGVYYRTLRIEDCHGWVAVSHEADNNQISMDISLESVEYLMASVNRLRCLFNLDTDPQVINSVFRSDELLGPLIEKSPGMRMPGAWSPFEYSIRAILGQQVSVSAATTIAGRIAEKYGTAPSIDTPAGLTRIFPFIEELAEADFDGLGLTKRRRATLMALVKAVAEKRVSMDPGQDLDNFVRDMTAIPGIGPWTAHYTAMRGFAHPDAFPESDLGILKALEKNGVRPKPAEAGKIAEKWRPWRAYAAFLLWSNLK